MDWTKYAGYKFKRLGRVYMITEVRMHGEFPVTIKRRDGFKTDIRLDYLAELIRENKLYR